MAPVPAEQGSAFAGMATSAVFGIQGQAIGRQLNVVLGEDSDTTALDCNVIPRPAERRLAEYGGLCRPAHRHALRCAVTTVAPPVQPLPGRANASLTYAGRMLVYPAIAARRQGEVNHVIDHSYGHLVDRLDPRGTVVTCHDLAPLVCPDPAAHGLSRPLWRYVFRGMLRSATHIIAPSDSTRCDLLRYAPSSPDRVTVVHLGVDHSTFYPRGEAEQPRARAAYRLPDDGPSILHNGHCGHHNNIVTLLQALPVPRQRGVEATLVQGGGRFTATPQALIARLDLQPRVRQILFVAAQHLPARNSPARVLVLPSWYEGFGLPALEAMAGGDDGRAAGTGALPEVVGDAGLLIDSADVQDLAGALARVLTDTNTRARVSERARNRAGAFSWERCARETMAVYGPVLEGARPQTVGSTRHV
jgi:glycosyltransferase involved in cell wall biosynthesis